MKEQNLAEEFRKIIDNMSDEELERKLKELEPLHDAGPKADDYLAFLEENKLVPKKGDFLKDEFGNIFICKEVYDNYWKDEYLGNAFCVLFNDMLFSGKYWIWKSCLVSYASKEEKHKLLKAIGEKGYIWDSEKLELIKILNNLNMEKQLNNSTFNLTEEELENFYNQNCRACGSQRCPGCYDEEWRDGCTLLKEYKGYVEKSKIKEHTMFNGNIHTITVETLLSNDDLFKKVLDLVGRVYDTEDENSFYKEIFDSKDILITYMELDEKVIGLGCICESHISYGIYELFWGMIDKDYRGNGWGKVLVDERINFVTKNMSGKSKPTDFFVVTESRWHLDRCGFHTLMRLNEKEYLMHKSAVEDNEF